eukprot:m.253749 g.253749  ORF g.253749 m.253749 type:complete len:405 (-) comp15487_c0_seq2:436-1650(-)
MVQAMQEDTPELDSFAALSLRDDLQLHRQPMYCEKYIIKPCLEGKDVLCEANLRTNRISSLSIAALQSTCLDVPETQVIVLGGMGDLFHIKHMMDELSTFRGPKIAVCNAWHSLDTDIEAIEEGIQIVLATPDRAHRLIDSDSLDVKGVKLLILYRVDCLMASPIMSMFTTALAKRFQDQQDVRTLLFTTSKEQALDYTSQFLQDPVEFHIERPLQLPSLSPPLHFHFQRVKHYFITGIVEESYRQDILFDFFMTAWPDAGDERVWRFTRFIVYFDTEERLKSIHDDAAELLPDGDLVMALTEDMTEVERQQTVDAFFASRSPLLLTTDPFACYFDRDPHTFFVNFNVPTTFLKYGQRLGHIDRCAEAKVITFVGPDEQEAFNALKAHHCVAMEPLTSDFLDIA